MAEKMNRPYMAQRRLAISRYIVPCQMVIIDLRPETPKSLYDSRFWQFHHAETRNNGYGAELTQWLIAMNAPVIHFRDTARGCVVTALRRKGGNDV